MKRILIMGLLAVAGVASAQITNGGFETGDLTGWTTLASSPAPVVNNASAHSGTFSAFIGSAPGGETPGNSAIVSTNFTVGAGGGTLSFWQFRTTVDSISFDWQDAYVTDTSNNILATIFHTCQTDTAWNQTSYSMSAFAGQTVRVEFLVHGDNAGDPTNMRIDDVTFTPVPEPASMAALAMGAIALIRRRRKS